MKITSWEPAVIQSFLCWCYWTSPSGCDWHHVSGMLHSDLERTHFLNYVWLLLLGTSCTANIAASRNCAPPRCSPL